MAKNNNLQDLLRSVSDVLRAAEGSTALINPQDYDNKIAECIVDAPSVHSWADTRTTADGGTIKDGIAYVKALRGKSVKFNQLIKVATNTNTKTQSGITITDNRDGSYKVSGTAAAGAPIYLSNICGSIKANHKYLFWVGVASSWNTQNKPRIYAAAFGGGSSANYTNGIVLTASSDASSSDIILFHYADSTHDYTITPKLCDLTEIYGSGNEPTSIDKLAQDMGYADSFGTANFPYHPTTIVLNCKQKSVISKDADGQTLDTLTLPTLTAFPNGLCGVGTAYDEVDLAEGKATKRVGCVDLGTLNWVNSDVYGYTLQVPNHKRGGQFLWIKPKDVIFAAQFNTGNDGFVIQYPSGTYADNAALKADMSGVMLFYEMNTEEQSTFTPCRAYYKASNNGQETATADTATAPFTAEIGYKEPTATELVNALNG